jgi:isopenicillin N synthase-like dioxygenase
MAGSSVPVIDISSLPLGGEERSATVARIGAACRDWGFFQATGHLLPADLIRRVWSETRRFFAQPDEVKTRASRSKDNARGWFNRELTKNRRDMKEVYDFGYVPHPDLPHEHPLNRTHDGVNLWPDSRWCPEFRPTLWAYFQACERLAFILLEAVGESLGVAPGRLTHEFSSGHTSFLRLNYFPVQDPLGGTRSSAGSGHLGIHHHTDAGALTVLLQDDVGGLQVCFDNHWVPVEPVSGALVVNIGDIIQVWSNDRYQAPLHRVLPSEGHERYSLPFFFNPAYETEYAPLPELRSDGSLPHYRPIKWSEFRLQRQQGDYADYGAENQIADYRVSS